MKTICWALQDKRGRFVQHDAVTHFEQFRAVTFRTRKQAVEWLKNDRFWYGRAETAKVCISMSNYPF